MKQLQAILHTKAALVSVIVLILVLLLSQFDLIANFNKESNLSDNIVQQEYDHDADQNINSQVDKDELLDNLDNNESNDYDETETDGNSQVLNLLKPSATPDVSVDNSSDSSSTTIPSTPSIFDSSILKYIATISIFNIEVIDNYGVFNDVTLFSTSENRSYYFDSTDIENEILKCIGSSGIVIESIEYNESLNKLVVTLSKSEQTTTVVLENQGIVLRNYVTLDLNEVFLQTFDGYPDTNEYGQEMPKYGTNETYLTPIDGYTATPPSFVPLVSYKNNRYSSGNYTFLGWYTQPTGGELFDFTSSTITEPFTLYAQWAKNVVSDNGSVYNVNSSKFQNTAISAYTAASNNIDQNTTDTSLLWTAAGISDPSTIEVLNENQEILYTSEKVPVAATIKWSITNTETINNQTTFTLSGFIILPDGYTWSSSSTIDERITGKITIDLTPVKVSSLYHDQLIYNHSYQAGLVLLKLDTLPTEITYFNSTNNSTQINSIQSTAFNSTDKYPMLILENGDIIDNILNASNCTLTAIFYPSDGNNKAYITFTVIADTLPDGYDLVNSNPNTITIKLDVTPATNSILNDEPLANDITDDIENDSSDENISTE